MSRSVLRFHHSIPLTGLDVFVALCPPPAILAECSGLAAYIANVDRLLRSLLNQVTNCPATTVGVEPQATKLLLYLVDLERGCRVRSSGASHSRVSASPARTIGSICSHSRHTKSNQPSPCANPKPLRSAEDCHQGRTRSATAL